MNLKLTKDEMFFAMQFYVLQFFEILEYEVTDAQFIGELSKLEDNDIIYSMNILKLNNRTSPVPTMCFVSKDSFYVVLNACGDLNVVVDEYIALDNNGSIVYDRQGFANADIGKDIRVDLDMCKIDYIKSTDDYTRYKNIGLMK